MAEYIERKELILSFNLAAERSGDPDCPWDMSAIETEIEAAPAADVAPVVHGRWYDANSYEHGEKVIATCSHCRVRGAVRTKRTEYGFWVIDSTVCPNCGARMDGK